jgi:hypothetical protein
MRNRLLGSMVAIVALLAGASSLSAQGPGQQGRAPAEVKPAPRLPDGKPDLSGVWTVRGDNRIFGTRQGGTGREQAVTPAEEALKPEVREKYRAQLQAGKLRTIERDNFDPAIRACAPFGTSRMIQQGRPFEIFQIPGRVIFRYEQEHWVRNIWMDGRGHPQDLIPTWMGHSIGRWDGDTLVVDTAGFNDLTWLDSPGHPHSESLRLEQRYTRVNHDTMEIQLTVHDPEIYTKPLVSNKLTYRLIPNGEITEWVNCEDRLNMHMEMDVCEITGAWEYEAYCKKRETGAPASGRPSGY